MIVAVDAVPPVGSRVEDPGVRLGRNPLNLKLIASLWDFLNLNLFYF